MTVAFDRGGKRNGGAGQAAGGRGKQREVITERRWHGRQSGRLGDAIATRRLSGRSEWKASEVLLSCVSRFPRSLHKSSSPVLGYPFHPPAGREERGRASRRSANASSLGWAWERALMRDPHLAGPGAGSRSWFSWPAHVSLGPAFCFLYSS